MTFEEWWENYGQRVDCATHEERARQAWDASWDTIAKSLEIRLDDIGETVTAILENQIGL